MTSFADHVSYSYQHSWANVPLLMTYS